MMFYVKHISWSKSFLVNVHGSIGERSELASHQAEMGKMECWVKDFLKEWHWSWYQCDERPAIGPAEGRVFQAEGIASTKSWGRKAFYCVCTTARRPRGWWWISKGSNGGRSDTKEVAWGQMKCNHASHSKDFGFFFCEHHWKPLENRSWDNGFLFWLRQINFLLKYHTHTHTEADK